MIRSLIVDTHDAPLSSTEVALCASMPEVVLRGFIADLCRLISWADNPRTDGYCSNGSDERSMAREYYERVVYPWWNKPL